MTKIFTQNRMKKLSALLSGSKVHMTALLVAVMLSSSLFAQTLVTVLPNTNATSGNGRAPQGTRLYINTMYILFPSDMAAYGADNVTSVGWTWNNPLGAGAPTTQSVATTGTLIIYMQNTTDVTYTKGTTFSTVGMTKVYDGTITIPATAAQINIDVPLGGPGTSPFTTIAGQGVYIAFEYHTTTTLATPIGAPTVSCNANITGSAATYQSQLANGTAMTLTAFRPETRLGTANSDMVQVQSLYTLGTTAALFANPQPLQAVVKNSSGATQSFNVDFTIKEKATGTVRHSSSIPVTLGAGLTTTVDDLGWNATLTELDTATVEVTPLPGETITINNSKGYRHNVTADSYNYADLSASTGGVGYGLGSGLILNKYHIDGCTNVKQVRVYMGDANTAFNVVYAVVMDAAGTIVGQSADYTVMPADIANYVTFDIPTPPNFTDADYYVGLAQLASVVAHYPVGTQAEPFPSRSNAYYATGLAGGIPLMYTTLGRWVIEAVITPLSTTPTTSGDATLCLGDAMDISVIDGILNPYATYNWYTDGCGTTFVGTGSTISVSPTTTTTYYVRAEDPCNGVNTACGSLTITIDIPETYYADVDGDGYGNAGSTTLACSLPDGYSTDDTDCDDAQSTVYPGATEVCDGLDNDCDGDYDEGTASATVSPAVAASGCKDTGVDLTANAGVGYTYQWFKNGNVIAGATSMVYNTNKPAYYQVQVTIPEGCFALSDATLVTINPMPNANISAPLGTSLCTTVKLKASYDASYTWQWNLEGTPIGGATSYTYFPVAAGNYSCTVTNALGCSRVTATLAVSACKEGEEIGGSFDVYPNPTSGEFMLNLSVDGADAGQAFINVYNVIGDLVYTSAASVINGSVQEAITLDSPAGVYLIKVTTEGSEKEYNAKVVLTK